MYGIRQLVERKLVTDCPKWLPDNTHYETAMGSFVYGVSGDTSDLDVYGFCIPPKGLVFPHLAGEIPGFGRQVKRFEQYQRHHIRDPDALGGTGRTYDVTNFSIVKYFQLAMENNPNVVDALFTPVTAVISSTRIGQHVRENRRLFLHRGCWHKFKGYAYSQLHATKNKKPEPGSKRWELVQRHGYDTKYGYHLVRLMDEVEQILTTGDLDLQRAREQMKAVRNGEWSLERLEGWFQERERDLERAYQESELPYQPDEGRIKKLLLECLEDHYGSLADAMAQPDAALEALRQIQGILNRTPGL